MSHTITHHVLSILDAFKAGEMIVVTDDDDREGEGDLIVAASLCTPEKMAFIVRHTSGIVCTPISGLEAQRLQLTPMVAVNDAPLSTAFTVTVDYKRGLTTGISAEERTATARALANGNISADEFVRPGHIFPLIAREGGVLLRSGHTEAAVDLCQLAGLPAVGVISELVNDNGTVMKGAEVTAFAQKHNLKHLTIDDLIAYRQAREKLVERVSEFEVHSDIGTLKGYAYTTPFDTIHNFAFVYGTPPKDQPVLTRFHRGNVIADSFGGGKTLKAALKRFAENGSGILVFLRDGTAGVPISGQNQDQNQFSTESTSEHGTQQKRQSFWREVGLGAQILRDLNVYSIRLLASSNRQFAGLSGFEIDIAATEML
jgi:3,4-dihydroxy 2-butanone 4-phosphate synthase / GTP cyclohydrolase II